MLVCYIPRDKAAKLPASDAVILDVNAIVLLTPIVAMFIHRGG